MASVDLWQAINAAFNSGNLRADAKANIQRILSAGEKDFYGRVITELAAAGEWAELNDRFYKTLAFGTGGLRGRTIGKIVTAAERGTPTALGRPQFPCVGTNAMNYLNVGRATQGLIAYVKKWRSRQQASGGAKVVIAHDTRHFSEEFTDIAAEVVARNGCEAIVFNGPRSTPELSFAVRYLRADAGIVITASHNPPHDNGYKVYFSDGGQVIEPHASGIIAEVNALAGEQADGDNSRCEITRIGQKVDDAYMARLDTLILNRELFAMASGLKIVYTPIHGTGGVILIPMFKRLGLNFGVVAKQEQFDGRFPTVKSPNPENPEALELGIDQARREAADLVVATDPDCDRIGVAVSNADNSFRLLSGNQIGSLIAYYRVKTFFERGILNHENARRAVIIKTFVTSDLQRAIADKFGIRCVETLTGFKYIGAKLQKYENALSDADRYRDLAEEETRRRRLADSSFYVFGGEESYGYSGADFVRDKDGNGAAIMFCEVAAYAKVSGRTVDQLLDAIYCEFGYFDEKSTSLVFEGADGAEKIRVLLSSYDKDPPQEILGRTVVATRNFEKDEIRDVEGDLIPKEKMFIFEFADKTRVAVRGSGTEPKIKYYLFGRHSTGNGTVSPERLQKIKADTSQFLESLWQWLRADVDRRLKNKALDTV